ncbi:hypothetical protein JCM11251_005147 [Rhodosporidiobolus azoricus]
MLTALPTAPVPLLAPSLNLASPSPLSFGIALVVLVLFFLARLFFFPARKKPLTLTELNTLLNRNENGGTGVWARKLRRALFPPTTWGDEDELEGAGIEDVGKEGENDGWTVRSTPVPNGLRSCLKKVEEFEAALRSAVDAVAEAADEDVAAASFPPSPSPAPSSASTPTVLPRTASPARPKRVRIAEPVKDELEALREMWASPELQGDGGNGGIGGYRRTRYFYSKSQGGKAVIKGGKEEKEGKKDEKEKAEPATISITEIAPACNPADAPLPTLATRRSSGTRVGLASGASPSSSAFNRSSSLSPSPHTRRPPHIRTLSPSKLGTSAQRRRALSPVPPGVGGRSASLPPSVERASSPGGPPVQATAVPRWVKTRGGRMTSPALVARRSNSGSSKSSGEEDEESEEVDDFDDAPSPSSLSSPLSSLCASDTEPGNSSLGSPSPLISTRNVPPISTSVSAPGASPTSLASPPPSVIISPSTPPAKTIDLPLRESPPAPPMAPPTVPVSSSSPPPAPTTTSTASTSPSTTSSASTTSTFNRSPSPSPSPCVQKERRLSLRVEQALGSKKQRQKEQQQHHHHAGRQAVEA